MSDQIDSVRTVARKHRWRDYSTPSGRRPVHDFMEELSDEDVANVAAAMKEVADGGVAAARHLRGEIYEVRADGRRTTYRILFAREGKHGQVLLALEAFSKKTRSTPTQTIALAERRLREWRGRRSR